MHNQHRLLVRFERLQHKNLKTFKCLCLVDRGQRSLQGTSIKPIASQQCHGLHVLRASERFRAVQPISAGSSPARTKQDAIHATPTWRWPAVLGLRGFCSTSGI